MKKEDKDFLENFVHLDELSAEKKFLCVYKHSSLLLLLPLDKKHALRTLTLYQPQSFKAKLYVYYIKFLICFRATFLFEKITVGEFHQEYKYLSECEQVGFLFGNPTAEHRRLIIYHSREGHSYVSKLASTVKSDSLVADEMANLNLVSGVLRGAPSICENKNNSYTVNWIAGKSPTPNDDASLCELLLSWITIKEASRLSDIALWQTILENSTGSDEEEIAKLGQKKITSCPVHGDFAPWNIKISKNGEVHVLDWESYEAQGVAGWDWAHYMIQSKLLIGKMWAEEAIELTIRWAKTPEGAMFLEKCGWGEDHLAWLGSYLYYAHYKLEFDRTELIQCWKRIAKNQSSS